MNQLEFFDIPSPCRGICKVNNRGYCIGCARSRDERFRWLEFTDSEKRHVITLCKQRFQRARALAAQTQQTTQSDSQAQLTMFDQDIGDA
ncbi:DUF1289 domain-containing protein [Paraferrimonas haliotis]|uniref:DUF1289 domain-containing protein n=1 Tax=Paraferrimonas haliotis TaxID=2013866 RepID=A0AA37TQL1_9GAMM|nr:DUF1289 domain-containing protein [Paraferrimonas haliotis]GLS82482.1 hypothetical protein GCM10007894_04590 [Paraferrimonas haliotis]